MQFTLEHSPQCIPADPDMGSNGRDLQIFLKIRFHDRNCTGKRGPDEFVFLKLFGKVYQKTEGPDGIFCDCKKIGRNGTGSMRDPFLFFAEIQVDLSEKN